MPVQCPYCKDNLHPKPGEQGYLEMCLRTFISKDEALELLQFDDTYKKIHVYINPGYKLVGADWKYENIVGLLDEAHAIEIANANGKIRKMGHGICVWVDRNPQRNHFLATNEAKLKVFEVLHDKRN